MTLYHLTPPYADTPLDKSGMMTTAHGLRIACLGGIYDPNIYTASDTVQVKFSLHSFEYSVLILSNYRDSHPHISLAKQLRNFWPTP